METKAKITVERANNGAALNLVDMAGRTVATLNQQEAAALAATLQEQTDALVLAIKVRAEIEEARAKATQEILDKHGLRGVP